MQDKGHPSEMRHTTLYSMASIAALRTFFLTWSLLTVVACYYGLTSYLLALCPSLLSFGFLLLIWPKGQAELFSATPSTNAKRKAILAELCAVIYIICAASSLFFRFRSENLSSEVSLLLLRKQALTTIWKLDLGASLAIVLAHMTGHHDICDRIHRRLLRLALALHVTCWSMYVVCYDALQDLPKDLEDQRNLCQESLIDFTDAAGDPALATPLIPSPATVDFMPSEQQIQKINDVGGMTNGDGTDLVRKYPLMRRLSSDPYEAVHQGFRSMGAQVRWSSLRYRLRIQRLPLREFLLFVASRVQSDRLEVELGYSNASPTPVQFLPIKPRPIGNHPPLFTSVVMDILHQQPHNGHDGQRWHPLRLSEELQSLDKGKHGNLAPPIFQLPGTIQNINIKALPDTGSSQNVIDQYLVQNLSPPVLIQPVEINVDKPLVAPDGELIPFVGKVHLHWMFKHGHKVYKKWFYVVPGCSHGVIIGNGFLQETETMSKHQDRLEITEPIEPDPLVGNLVSEAQQDDCLHQIVRGTINGKPAESSLDTGCQANLMSLDYANRLDLSLLTTSVGSQLVKFADGRKRPTLGQVEIDWSFADTPEKVVAVRCHVLPTCIHPVIFGDRFVLSEKPWEKHDSSLHQIPSSTADIGPVGLYRSPFPWLGHKPDPQAEALLREKQAKNDRATALLASLNEGPLQHPQQLVMPAIPNPAVVRAPPTIAQASPPVSTGASGTQAPPQIPSPSQNNAAASHSPLTSNSITTSNPSTSNSNPPSQLTPRQQSSAPQCPAPLTPRP